MIIPGDSSHLRVEVASNERALLALEHPWNAAVEQAGGQTPFLSFDWVRTWWEAFGEGHSLHVLVVRDGNEVVAIAPMMENRTRLYGVEVRRLALIHNVHTPRTDVIIVSQAARAYAALAEHLEAQRQHVDMIEMPQIPATSPTLSALLHLTRTHGWLAGTWQPLPGRLLHLPPDWADYVNALPTRHRHNIRTRLRRLERLGEVVLHQVTGGPKLDEALAEGLRIEASGWKGGAGTAISANDSERLFYTRIAERAAAHGWLRLLFLTVGGQRIAFSFGLRVGRTLYLLKQGYDPAYRAYSPSHLLCFLALRAAVAEGLEVLDFLGDDEPWKRKWTTEVLLCRWLYLFPTRLRPWLLYQAKFRAAPRLRWLQQDAVTAREHYDR